MKELISKYQTMAVDSFKKLSLREKVILVVPSFFFSIFLVYAIFWKPMSNAFAAQAATLNESEGNVKVVTAMLQKYTRLKNRRLEIEEQYKEIESSESGRTPLERLIKSKFDLPTGGYTIDAGDSQEFGGNYSKTPFRMKFKTANFAAIVSFVQELIHGQNPLIVKRLDLKRDSTRSLDVEIEASSIRQKGR